MGMNLEVPARIRSLRRTGLDAFGTLLSIYILSAISCIYILPLVLVFLNLNTL